MEELCRRREGAAVAALRLHDFRSREGRRSNRPYLPGPHQIGEHREGLLEVGIRSRTVDLVEIEVVGLQAAQRSLLDGLRYGANPSVNTPS